MWFASVFTDRTSPIRQIQLLIFQYFLKVKRTRKERRNVDTQHRKDNHDKRTHQHFWDRSEFWSNSGEIKSLLLFSQHWLWKCVRIEIAQIFDGNAYSCLRTWMLYTWLRNKEALTGWMGVDIIFITTFFLQEVSLCSFQFCLNVFVQQFSHIVISHNTTSQSSRTITQLYKVVQFFCTEPLHTLLLVLVLFLLINQYK